MKLSVAMCTYNRETFLPHCLKSLENQYFVKDLFEVLVNSRCNNA